MDENLIAQTVESLVRRGELTVDNMFQALPRPDGRYYSRYGIGFPLLMLPFFLMGYVLDWLFPHTAAFFKDPYFFSMLWGTVLITVLLGWLFYRLCLMLGATIPTAVLFSVSLIFATPFWPYGQTLFRLTAATVLLLVVLMLILRISQRQEAPNVPVNKCLIGIAASIAFGLNVREDLVIGFCLIWLYGLTELNNPNRVKLTAAYLIGGLLGMIVWGLHNYIRFDTFFIENYEDLSFNHPLIISIPELLFGTRAGLLLYAPLTLLLPLSLMSFSWRDRSNLHLWLLCAAILLAYLILYGKSTMWHGGRCWGPRHMYFLLPFAFLPGVWLFQDHVGQGHIKLWLKIFFSLSVLWGLYVNFTGIYAHQGRYMSFRDTPPFFEMLRQPLAHPLYNNMHDINLWWARMIKLQPYSLWPLAFILLVIITVYFGYRLYKETNYITKPS